jgi:hypothetical protein
LQEDVERDMQDLGNDEQGSSDPVQPPAEVKFPGQEYA